jgi:two-component system, sensor histidine kinase
VTSSDRDMQSPVLRFVGRVLVVDDNAINRLIVVEMLTRLGVDVEQAEHGEEALQRLVDAPFDLVLMDCLMPRMDGFEATRRWRQHECTAARARIPIVALTANAMAEDKVRCLDAGMDDLLAKPIQLPSLTSLLAGYIKAG